MGFRELYVIIPSWELSEEMDNNSIYGVSQ